MSEGDRTLFFSPSVTVGNYPRMGPCAGGCGCPEFKKKTPAAKCAACKALSKKRAKLRAQALAAKAKAAKAKR